MTVKDKTVLVTGGTSGIGEATARAFAAAGPMSSSPDVTISEGAGSSTRS